MTVYLGNVWLVDFFACAGLGVAAASCLLSWRNSLEPLINALRWPQARVALRLVVLAAFFGVQLAIVVFIADSEGLRMPNSGYGYPLGILAVSPAFLTVHPR